MRASSSIETTARTGTTRRHDLATLERSGVAGRECSRGRGMSRRRGCLSDVVGWAHSKQTERTRRRRDGKEGESKDNACRGLAKAPRGHGYGSTPEAQAL